MFGERLEAPASVDPSKSATEQRPVGDLRGSRGIWIRAPSLPPVHPSGASVKPAGLGRVLTLCGPATSSAQARPLFDDPAPVDRFHRATQLDMF